MGLVHVIVTGLVLAQASASFTALVKVTGQVINTVRPEIFGDNIEWTNDGMGFWDSRKKALDPQLVALAREIGVTHFRYPGGTLSDYFHWQWAVGSSRQAIINPFDKGNKAYPAFGPDELMSLCKQAHSRASITLNVGTGTPEEGAAWVRYNADRHNPVIDYEVGNEVYMRGTTDPAMTIDKTPQEYIDFYKKLEVAVHKAAPATKMGPVGLVDTGQFPLCKDPKWTEMILSALGDKMDFFAIHNGYSPVIRTTGVSPTAPRLSDDEFVTSTLASPIYVAANLKATEKLITKFCPNGGKMVGIHITESGPLVYPVGGGRDQEDLAWNRTLGCALYQAGLFNVLLSDSKVTSANHLPLCQDLFGALIGIHVTSSGRQVWRNIVSYIFQIYSARAGNDVLGVSVESPRRSTSSVGIVPALNDVPLIDACVFRSPDHRLFIMLINRDVNRSAQTTIAPGLPRFHLEQVTTLASASYKDANLPEQPNKVVPTIKRGPAGDSAKPLTVTLPKCSLTCLEIRVK
jgi:alpha-N-arabinofuranosidase